MININEIRLTKVRHTTELMKKTNVVGVAIGYKEKEGQKTETPSLVVMVRKKVPLSKLEASDVVPTEIEGIVTDVREVGEIKAL